MEEVKVLLKVTSLEGHTEFSLVPSDAIDKIKTLYNEEKKWTYIDGGLVSPTRVTEAMLLNAKSIVLSNAIVGGVDFAAYKNNNISDLTRNDVDAKVVPVDDDPVVDNCGPAPVVDKGHVVKDDIPAPASKKLDEVEIDLHITAFVSKDGNANAGPVHDGGRFLAAFEIVSATNSEPPKVVLHVDENHVAVIAHMREFMFKGTGLLFEDFLKEEVSKFKETFHVK